MALGNHIVEHLIETAEHLARQSGSGNLRKVMRRRAVSSAYYAAFHAIAYLFTEGTVRWSSENELVEPVFRSLDHKLVKNRLSSSADATVRAIGLIFAKLQERRYNADYAPPAHNPTLAETRDAIEEAREIVSLVDGLSAKRRRLVVALLIAKAR